MSNETKLVGGQSIQEQYAEMGKLKAQSKKMSTKIKTHLKKHKEAYIVGGVGLTVGVGVGYYLHSRLGVEVPTVSMDVINTVAPKSTIVGRDNTINNDIDITNNITNVVNMGGHVRKIVKRVSDGKLFGSVKEAANDAGVLQPVMSKHLNGKCEHIMGEQYVIEGLATN